MPYPVYSYTPSDVLSLVANVLFGGQRSFHTDAQICIEQLKPPLKILGAEHIPRTGPVLLAFNHYYRRGFHAWWLALALAAAIPLEIHFGMTGELTYPGRWYAPLGRLASRWLLQRLAEVYGFTLLPPMPPRPRDVEARARAVREFLAYAHSHPQAVLGLAPEGSDNPPDGMLDWPAPGVGRFISLLAELGFPILPVGIYEETGEFCLHFGTSFTLDVPRGKSTDERDRLAAETVMRRIAVLLPPRLRGYFQ